MPRILPSLLLLVLASPLLAQSGDILSRIDGQAQMEGSGGSIADLGDINGDGVSDFVVGGDQYITHGARLFRRR